VRSARSRSPDSMVCCALRNQANTEVGSGDFGEETSSAPSGVRVTGSRMATPAQSHSWKPAHQCSGPRIMMGPSLMRAVPIPLVPAPCSDQAKRAVRLALSACWSVSRSPQAARMPPRASVTATRPPIASTSGSIDLATPASSVTTTFSSRSWDASRSRAEGARSW
jgi:hypothetical protein